LAPLIALPKRRRGGAQSTLPAPRAPLPALQLPSLHGYVSSRLPSEWVPVITGALGAAHERVLEAAFEHERSALAALSALFPQADEAVWPVPALAVLIKRLYARARAADAEARGRGERRRALQLCADLLAELFRSLPSPPPPFPSLLS